ncbi:MerR family transcriptional regulator [Chromohalobacter israelensis]
MDTHQKLRHLRESIESSGAANAQELLAQVDDLLAGINHQRQRRGAIIQALAYEFLAPLASASESASQRHERIKELAMSLDETGVLHLFGQLEGVALEHINALYLLAQTTQPGAMKSHFDHLPEQLVNNADFLVNGHKRAGGASTAQRRKEEAAIRIQAAKGHYDRLLASNMGERNACSKVAEIMGVSPATVRNWRRAGWVLPEGKRK